jgi:putative tricarboxylic transport membrane protein
VLVCIIGAYSINGSLLDLWLLLIFGFVGYLMKKMEFPVAPAVLAIVLGPLLERSLYQSLTSAQGNLLIFFQRPISAALMGLSLLILLLRLFTMFRKSRVSLFENEEI